MLGLGSGFLGVGTATAQLAAYIQSGQWPSLSLFEALAYLGSITSPTWRTQIPLGSWPGGLAVRALEAIPTAPVLIGVGVLTAWRILASAGSSPTKLPDEPALDELRSRLAGPTLLVVSRRHPGLVARLRRQLRGHRDVEILLDRRTRERRARVRPQPFERRRGDRRDPPSTDRDLGIHPVVLIPRAGPALFEWLSVPPDPEG